jgi:hypothetical protein
MRTDPFLDPELRPVILRQMEFLKTAVMPQMIEYDRVHAEDIPGIMLSMLRLLMRMQLAHGVTVDELHGEVLFAAEDASAVAAD